MRHPLVPKKGRRIVWLDRNPAFEHVKAPVFVAYLAGLLQSEGCCEQLLRVQRVTSWSRQVFEGPRNTAKSTQGRFVVEGLGLGSIFFLGRGEDLNYSGSLLLFQVTTKEFRKTGREGILCRTCVQGS